MDNNARRALVVGLLADILELEVDEIRDDLSAETCETWDSIRHVSVILAIEEAFGVLFDEHELSGLMSLKSLLAALTVRQ